MTTPDREATLKGRSRARFGVLVAGTLLVALAGYIGFRLYPSIGAIAFVMGFGVLLSLGGGAIALQVTFTSGLGCALRVAVGMLLITMGLVQLGRIRIPFFKLAVLATPIEQRWRTAENPDRFSNHILYGFGYLIAGFG